MVDEQAINELRVCWKKMRGYATTFFTHLQEVHKEIGDEGFTDWCIDNLKVGPSKILQVADILNSVDAEIVKNNMRRATEAEKAQRKAAAEAKKAELERIRQEKEAERKREEEERARFQAEEDAIAATVKKSGRQRKATAAAEVRAKTLPALKKITKEHSDYLTRMKADHDLACAQFVKGGEYQISALKRMATNLADVKAHLKSTEAFGRWLATTNDPWGKTDRAALINIGIAMRQQSRVVDDVLRETDSRSPERLWHKVRSRLPINRNSDDATNVVGFPKSA